MNKEITITDLKAEAFDTQLQIDSLSKRYQQLIQAIYQKQQEPVKETKPDKKK